MTTERCQGDVSRPVRAGMADHDAVRQGRMQASRSGRRRAIVLVAVHVAIFAHILHWQLRGETISPLEPSEAMYSIASGAINAGALLMALSLLSVLVVGRWFCGWACHLVALQDLCGWLMARIGIRPKPLRSRLMMLVPLGAGLALFGMPVVARMMAGAPAPEASFELTKSEFWETFPGPILATITFLVCGFLMVYVLGAKGFCTYACPYGGLFGVVDRLSPGRIRVTDACRGCGHCTATCTSNVAVAEEVARFKMVVDQNCMKCLDCVSVCPEEALYFGFGKPALGARGKGRARPRWDFSFGDDAVMLAVFAITMAILTGVPEAFAPWSVRLYGTFPMLFATALAAVTGFAVMLCLRLWTRDELTLQKHVLKRDGKVTTSGRVFAVLTVSWLAFVAHSGLVQARTWSGERDYLALDVQNAVWRTAQNPTLQPETERLLVAARESFEAARSLGILEDARVATRLGELAVVDGDLDRAAREFREALRIEPRHAHVHADLGRTLYRKGDLDGAVHAFRAAVEHAPEQAGFHRELARLLVAAGRIDDAEPVLARLVVLVDDDVRPDFRVDHAVALLQLGRFPEGEQELRTALEERPDHERARAVLADLLARRPK